MRARVIRNLAIVGLAVFGLVSSSAALAQGSAGTNPNAGDIRTPINTEILIPTAPGLTPGSTPERVADYLTNGRVEDLAQYIGIIYNFLISIVGLVAAVAMIVGGFQYLTSAGDSSKIGAAKGKMSNAFIGLVLALGAYTILNTINPKLLELKLPDLRPVATEINLLPWCDDITDSAVTPVGPSKECGYAGTYQKGNTKSPCIWGGTCRLLRVSEKVTDVGDTPDSDEEDGMYKTCVQNGDVSDPKTMMEKIAQDPNAKFGECVYCADLTNARAASMHYPSVETACLAFMKSFDSAPEQLKEAYTLQVTGVTSKNGFFHGCYARSTTLKKKSREADKVLPGSIGCMGAPIWCYNVTRDDDSVGGNNGGKNNGCEGYDENPSPSWAGALDDKGFAKPRYIYDSDGMEEYPDHLTTMCFTNPCKDYLDPETGQQPFLNGCKSGNGKFYTVRRLASQGDFSIDDCRNK